MRSKPRCLPLTVFYCWDKWVIFDWILVTKLTFSLQVDSRCSRDSRSSRGPGRWGGSSSSGPKPDEQQTTPADTGTGGRGEDCSSLRANGKRIRDADGCFHPSGGGHHACECGQSPGERSEAVGAGRLRRRPAGRSLAVREQRCQTQEQVLVEKLQGGCDTRRFFHVEIRWLRRLFKYTELTVMFKKSAWDHFSSWHEVCYLAGSRIWMYCGHKRIGMVSDYGQTGCGGEMLFCIL